MTFIDIFKEAQALDQELQDGEDPVSAQRNMISTPRNIVAADLEKLKGQV